MTEPSVRVLFLCLSNSAASIVAEALLNSLGAPRFRAFSAGSHPSGRVNPLVLELLRQQRLPTEGLHSKSWDEFRGGNAAPIDLVVTVCRRIAAEPQPAWPGSPAVTHWPIPDATIVKGNIEARRHAFRATFDQLRARIVALAAQPPAEYASARKT